MKQIQHHNQFLSRTVNLNKTRIRTLKNRVSGIEMFIRNNQVFGPAFQKFETQGSWAHGTIIKPSPKSPGFDADVLLYMKEKRGWDAKDYVENLYQAFRTHGTYRGIVHRNTRCVVIDYRGEFHIDIVPTIAEQSWLGLGPKRTYITNRLENKFEQTNPEGYLSWFNEKTAQTNGMLEDVIRMTKYLRDIKKIFSAKSILLTTILADQVDTSWHSADDVQKFYPDLPTSLHTIYNRLDSYLQQNDSMPHIFNPSMENEDFVRHWDEAKYQNFRKWISFYTEKINQAMNANRKNGIVIWRQIFGEDFANGSNI